MKKLLFVLALALASCTAAPAWAQAFNAQNVQRYASSYKSVTALAANTPDTVFAPGSNTKGAILHACGFKTRSSATVPQAGFVAKTSAPTTVIDGDLLLMAGLFILATDYYESGVLQSPIFIAPGKGVYYISTNAEVAGAVRFCLYTLLQ